MQLESLYNQLPVQPEGSGRIPKYHLKYLKAKPLYWKDLQVRVWGKEDLDPSSLPH